MTDVPPGSVRSGRTDGFERKPEWLRVRAPGSDGYLRVKHAVRAHGLHTVCEEARCPNIGHCWHGGTATFMILGDICTRACGYCAVRSGRPLALDPAEPARVANAARAMGLRYAVITSVNRDDIPDGGASVFAATIREIRNLSPGCGVEVLIPDFKGDAPSLRTVLDARPDVLNHNVEIVPRLYRVVRPGGLYERALELLERSVRFAPDVTTKSGLMIGLGEQRDEIVSTLADLRRAGCSIVTIGQYLRPSPAHLPMIRYYHPDEFRELRERAVQMGFTHVESGPLVRSSYHAQQQFGAPR